MASVMGYWDVQALGHPIRFLLNYVGEEFEDKQYSVKQIGTEYDTSDWLNKKFTLGLDFPNLPYYMDGKAKISQSNTIYRYLGRKYNMAGKTDDERTRIDLALDQLLDTRWAMVRLCYFSPDFENERLSYIKELPDKLKLYENFLGDRPFIAGQDVTVPDFPMQTMLREHRLLAPECLNDFPKLQAFIDRFETGKLFISEGRLIPGRATKQRVMSLPQIKRYMESDGYPKLPLYNRMAHFGSKQGW